MPPRHAIRSRTQRKGCSTAGITSHEFTGDEHDSETNLDHTQFRQYSSSLGRWMHPDPAGLAAVDPTNPQSWNRYAYVRNIPLALIDPLGLTPQCYTVQNQGVDQELQQDSKTGGPFAADADPQNPSSGCLPRSGGIGNGDGFSLDGGYSADDSGMGFTSGITGGGAGGLAQIPMVAEAEYMISARLPMPVLDDYGDPIGASLLDMTWHSWGDILVGDGFYFTNPIPNSNAGISAGGGNSSGGETDNAKKLARALNATGVQSLGNPCSIASLYLISATSGLVLSPEVYAYAAGAVSTYWPGALQFGQNFVRNWTNRPTFLLWPLLKLGAKYGNQALAGIQQGCNALQ